MKNMNLTKVKNIIYIKCLIIKITKLNLTNKKYFKTFIFKNNFKINLLTGE